MLASLLPLESSAAHPALITTDRKLPWKNFGQVVQAKASELAEWARLKVALRMESNVDSVVTLAALTTLECDITLIGGDTADERVQEWTGDFGWSVVLDGYGSVQHRADSPHAPNPSDRVTILTSGTAGTAKAVEHSWETLTRPVRKTATPTDPCWLLTFRPHLYAGLQVLLQCLLNRGTLVVPGARATATDVAQMAGDAGVEFASATPSYWRWLTTMIDLDLLRRIPLKQITLGGEAVDQMTLDQLKNIFPQARIVHIYATTELGRCFSVTDGQEGFPARFLDGASDDGVEMRIVDDELVVRSANAMRGYKHVDAHSPQQKWFSTGDIVEQRDGRVRFVGRRTDMINVGGNKVYPFEIEALVRSVPGVADVRVFAEASSLVGQLVKCEVVLAEGYDAAKVESAIRAKAIDRLNSFQQPRLFSFVNEIPLTTAGKIRRR